MSYILLEPFVVIISGKFLNTWEREEIHVVIHWILVEVENFTSDGVWENCFLRIKRRNLIVIFPVNPEGMIAVKQRSLH